MKDSIESCSEVLTKLFNNTILTSNFPDKLKVADVSPILKKITHKNQRITDLSLFLVSKVFERLLHKQMSLHVEEHLSPYLCGYRKGFRTQQALLSLLERWKNVLDKKRYGGTALMDLSKAFDTLNHDLLAAKLHAYDFSEESPQLIKSYLTKRWQRTKFNVSFSNWTELLLGVPQESVLGPLLFNIIIY